MTETPESRAEPTTVTGQTRYDNPYDRPNRPGQVLAWVGIIAGVVFIVAVIFFSGFFAGRWSGGHYAHYGRYHDGHHGYYCSQPGPGGVTSPGGMRGPGEPVGPMGPGQPWPTTRAPTAPRP